MATASGMASGRQIVKRVFDVVTAAILLVVLSPLLALTAAAGAAFVGRPVLFRQPRPGFHGAPFRIIKFRTMTDATDADGKLLPDELRLTGFGRFLRATSLDELPELWNVLKGDMSIVGPRPLLMEYLPMYSSRQARRHEVRPGITGWAQVHGRNHLSWEQKFELDVWYVENASFAVDMKILLMTVRQVFTGKGITAREHSTVRRFKGSGPHAGA